MRISLAAIITMALLLSGAVVFSAHADTVAGAGEYKLLVSILTGNLGAFLGLGLTIFGLWSFAAKGQTQFGIALIIVGVLITMLPTFYKGVRLLVCPIVTSLGGSCGGGGIDVTSG